MTRQRHLGRLLAGVALALPVLLAACSSGGAQDLPTIPPETPTPAATATEAAHPGPTYPPGCPTEQPAALGADDVRTVTITTDKGDIVIEIKGALSPIATGNFVELASCGYYDMVVFHRLVPGFVIQGGDGMFGRSPDVIPDLVGSGGPKYTIQDEPVTTTYHRGTVAMARTSDPNSVGSQFFIVTDDAAESALASANTYQIIGEVTAGMDVVDTIAAMPNAGPPGNAAIDYVPMTKVTVTTP
ncbi:MAG: peptidylprolyl isomerase [Chloroflexi bacterium]|nr:peptidylprolyl isomerase [Chloroflexota bacterium]